MNNIQIIYEDDSIIVIDKPAGILVHPTTADESDTVTSWFVDKYPQIANIDWSDNTRIGIVHRLDKDTSGLMILSKNPEVLIKFQAKFKNHEIKKTYQALVVGKTPEQGKIEIGIVRDTDKDIMKVQETTYSFTKGTVRASVTEYKTLKRYRYQNNDLTLIEVNPQTGRMHQIRVHMKYAGFPLIGDQLYQTKLSNQLSKDLNINRQFLHAVKLQFDGREFSSELADDLKEVIEKLQDE